MFGDSLDALRSLLVANFPDVKKIYTSTMPGSFTRPSFFINVATSNEEHLSRAMYQTDITWQIVYFAPLDSKEQVNVFNQLEVSGKLKRLLMELLVLKGPSGTVYHILETDGGPRESEVYIAVDLHVEFSRPEEQFEYMHEVHIKHKEG